MSILKNPSAAFSTSLIYITVGTLIDIWTIVSLVFYRPSSDGGLFLVVGFLATGLGLLIIGLILGQMSRAARRAELPPAEVTHAVAQVEQAAAANPSPVVPGNFNPQTAAAIVTESAAPPNAPTASTPGPIPRR